MRNRKYFRRGAAAVLFLGLIPALSGCSDTDAAAVTQQMTEMTAQLQQGTEAIQEVTRRAEEGTKWLEELSVQLQAYAQLLQDGTTYLQDGSKLLEEGMKLAEDNTKLLEDAVAAELEKQGLTREEAVFLIQEEAQNQLAEYVGDEDPAELAQAFLKDLDAGRLELPSEEELSAAIEEVRTLAEEAGQDAAKELLDTARDPETQENLQKAAEEVKKKAEEAGITKETIGRAASEASEKLEEAGITQEAMEKAVESTEEEIREQTSERQETLDRILHGTSLHRN